MEKKVFRASATAFVGESLETVFIVFGTFFFIGQDFVSSANFFEFVFVSALIGMVFDG